MGHHATSEHSHPGDRAKSGSNAAAQTAEGFCTSQPEVLPPTQGMGSVSKGKGKCLCQKKRKHDCPIQSNSTSTQRIGSPNNSASSRRRKMEKNWQNSGSIA